MNTTTIEEFNKNLITQDKRVSSKTSNLNGRRRKKDNMEKKVRFLIQRLANPDETKSKRALERLIAIGEPAVKPLIRSLRKTEGMDLKIQALAGIGVPAIEPTVAKLHILDLAIVGSILKLIGTPSIEPIVKAFDKHFPLVYTIIEIIGELSISPLIDILRRDDRDAVAAADLLILFGKPAVNPLNKLLKDTQISDRVRSLAKESVKLAKKDRYSIHKSLLEENINVFILLLKEHRNDNGAYSMALLLRYIGRPAVEPLKDLLKSPDICDDVRFLAQKTLREIKEDLSNNSLEAFN